MQYLNGSDGGVNDYAVVATHKGILLAVRPLCVMSKDAVVLGMRVRSSAPQIPGVSLDKLRQAWPVFEFPVARETYVSLTMVKLCQFTSISEEVPNHISAILVQLIAKATQNAEWKAPQEEVSAFIRERFKSEFQPMFKFLQDEGKLGLKPIK